MGKKLVLALDVDDVLVEFNSIVLADTNDLFSELYPEDRLEDLAWNFMNLPAAKRSYAFSLFSSPRIHNQLELKPGAKLFVEWAMSNFEVVFVTSVFLEMVAIRDAFLKSHFGDDIEVVYTTRKHRVAADFLVDDSPTHLALSTAAIPIAMDAPWNRDFPAEYRVTNFNELRLLLEKHSERLKNKKNEKLYPW